MTARCTPASRVGMPSLGMMSVLLVFFFTLFHLPAPLEAQPDFDFLIRGGKVLDGTGNPWYYADIGIRGDRVVGMGDLSGATATRVIDARGLYVSPGFIDVHSHAGPGLATPGLSAAIPLLTQGITTVMVNPDGGGEVDLVTQRRELLVDGLGVNVALMVPHGSVRREVLGMEDRAPTSAELDLMRSLVRAGMEAGAFGLSSGPYYAPGSFSTTDELVDLARIAAEFGGVYTSHIRDESDYTIGVVAAVDEVIQVAREAGLPGIVTHIKALGPRVWGYSQALVSRIDRARAQGLEIFADQYPYEASSTGLSAALVPRWAQAGGQEALAARATDPNIRPQLIAEMHDNLDRRGGADRLQISRYAENPSIEGQTLEQVANARRGDPVEVALDLILAGEGPGVVSFNMAEGDIRTLMRQPWMMTGSDGTLVPMGSGVPHPRAYGSYPRKIRHYVLEQEVLDLGAAIRSMTSLPATVFRVADRGLLREGAIADVVIFDLERIRDRATYESPHQLSEGIVQVFVNGGLALEAERVTADRFGLVLNR